MIPGAQKPITLEPTTNIPQKRVWGLKAGPQGSWKLRLFLAANAFEDSDIGLNTLHSVLTETGFTTFVLDANNTGYYLSFENSSEGTLLARCCFRKLQNLKVVTSLGSTVVLNFQRIVDSESAGKDDWPRRSGAQQPIPQQENNLPPDFPRNNIDRSPGYSLAPAAGEPHLPTNVVHQPLSPRRLKQDASWSIQNEPSASSGDSAPEMDGMGYEKVGYAYQHPNAPPFYSIYPSHPGMYGPHFHPPPSHARPFRPPMPGEGGITT